MKILFTAKEDNWDAPIDPRFGRMAYILLYDEESGELSSIPNPEADSVGHHVGLEMADRVLGLHPDVIITGNGPGNKVARVLYRSNIVIYVGAENMSVKEAYEAFKANDLQTL